MVQYCCIASCRNNTRRCKKSSFHCFPIDKELRAKWIEVTRLDTQIPRNKTPDHLNITAATKVCSKHFLPYDMYNNNHGTRLHRNSIPSIFPWTEESWEKNSSNLNMESNQDSASEESTMQETEANSFPVSSHFLAETDTNVEIQPTLPTSPKREKQTDEPGELETIMLKIEDEEAYLEAETQEANQTMCRVCLKDYAEIGQLFPLNSLVHCNNRQLSIISCLNVVLKEQISTRGPYPANICAGCIERIVNAYLLIEQYQTNQERFKELQKLNKLKQQPMIVDNNTDTTMDIETKLEPEIECVEDDYRLSANAAFIEHEESTKEQEVEEYDDEEEIVDQPTTSSSRTSEIPGNPLITCKECQVSVELSFLQDHLTNCRMVQMKSSDSVPVECKLFVCKVCCTLMYVEDRDTHSVTCQSYQYQGHREPPDVVVVDDD